MEAVAGDLAALQPPGQLPGEQDVAQLAVAVLPVGLPEAAALSRIPEVHQEAEVQLAPSVGAGGHVDHAARPAGLQPLQKQQGQQEVAQMVDPEHQAEAVVRLAVSEDTWRKRPSPSPPNPRWSDP